MSRMDPELVRWCAYQFLKHTCPHHFPVTEAVEVNKGILNSPRKEHSFFCTSPISLPGIINRY